MQAQALPVQALLQHWLLAVQATVFPRQQLAVVTEQLLRGLHAANPQPPARVQPQV